MSAAGGVVEVAGGCQDCRAEQQLRPVVGAVELVVLHAATCPALARVQQLLEDER